MPDYRMNKDKPIGSRSLSTIAGFAPNRRPKPAPPKLKPKQSFEVTPDLGDTAQAEEMPMAEALGTMITQDKITNERTTDEAFATGQQSVNSPGDNESTSVETDDASNEEAEGDAEPDAKAETSAAEESVDNDSDAAGDSEVSEDVDQGEESDSADVPDIVLVVTPPVDFEHEDKDNVTEQSKESK